MELIMTRRKMHLFKWLMVFIPPVTVAGGHLLAEYWVPLLRHTGARHTENPLVAPLVILLVTLLALLLSYAFVETLFRVLRRLQAETLAQEQDILTMTAVMQERERLSRELHDGVSQLVADLLLRLDTIRELVKAGRQGDAETELERLYRVGDEIYTDVRESITGLRSSVSERGLTRALRDYLDEFEERHDISVSLRADDAAGNLTPLAALQIFRLVQEALTNVRKHSGAREARVSLVADGVDQLRIAVTDDGQGFSPHAGSIGSGRPLGLKSMRERVEALGGTFYVESEPGSGTQVSATVPVRTRSREETRAAAATPAG
jgi:two-component system, NarL family, sensor histidine kinase DegS